MGSKARAPPLTLSTIPEFAAPAQATVASPCSDLSMAAAPLPIDAGFPAIMFRPNYGAIFQIRWLDPAGVEIAFDMTDADDYYHLRPRVALGAGIHTLIYVDDCTDPSRPPPPPRQIELDFEVAPPPPQRLGSLRIDYEKYCPDDPGRKFAPYWPPPVTVGLVLDPALVPYVPILKITVRDDTGSFLAAYWASQWIWLPTGFERSVSLGCDDYVHTLPPGTRSFVAEGNLLDGPALEPATASALLECANCRRDAGTGPSPVPTSTTTWTATRPSDDGGCIVSARSRRTSPRAGWGTMLLAVAGALVQRRRPRRAAAKLAIRGV